MTIITVDDEPAALNMITNAVKSVCQDAEIYPFKNANEAYEFAKENVVDVAFLDIQMRQMSGLELAKKIKETNLKVNLIFVTGFEEYGIEAVQLHACGYLEKPVDEEDVKKAMANLLYPVEEQKNLYVQTFGNFELFYQGKPVIFERAKAKELLAYLVNLRGGTATRKELAAILFEDQEYNLKTTDYLTKIYGSLKTALREVDAEDMLIKGRNVYGIDVTKVACDAYEFLEGKQNAINSFQGEYMNQYSWAEGYIGIFSK